MAKVKTFLLSFLIAALSIVFIAGCSTDTSSSNLGGGSSSGTDNGGSTENPGGEEDKPGVTAIDLAGNPFSLLGVYDVTLYGIDGEPVTTPASKSELRVGLNLETAAGGMTAPEVIMYLDFEGKKINFDTYYIDLSGLASAGGDLNKFIADTFANLGAELIENSKYGLYFTLDPAKNTQYQPLIDKNVITSGQYLKLKLTKIKDIAQDSGLGDTDIPETPETPSEPVKVESIQITTPEKSYYTGSTVTIDFTLTPNNTTETEVSYQSTNNGSGTITAVNGKGQLVLENVTQNDTVIFTIANGVTSNYAITVVNDITEIYFPQDSYVLEQGMEQTVIIENYDSIVDALKSVEYSVNDNTKANIDVATGRVIGLKNGVVTVTATATKLDGTQLTTSYELDVLGHIDYSSPEAFLESSIGTYEIYFFGTKPGNATDGNSVTDVIVTNNCDTFVELFGGSCAGEGGMPIFGIPNKIEVGSNFAGLATITEKNGGIDLITKIYMTASGIRSNSADDQYQYTLYRTTSYTDPNNANTSVKDVRGRHLTATFDFPDSTFKVEKYNDANPLTIKIFSQIMGKVVDASVLGKKTINPTTYMLAIKTSSQPQVLDYNDVSQAPFNKVGDNPGSPTNLGDNIPYY